MSFGWKRGSQSNLFSRRSRMSLALERVVRTSSRTCFDPRHLIPMIWWPSGRER
jgi:hypothetical protein